MAFNIKTLIMILIPNVLAILACIWVGINLKRNFAEMDKEEWEKPFRE